MFDPLYVRPDDVGTQRNRSLIMAQPTALQELSATAPYKGKAGVIVPVEDDRRKQHSRDRRQSLQRRQQKFPCLVNTRNNRERRIQTRRHKDAFQLESGRELSQGFDAVV